MSNTSKEQVKQASIELYQEVDECITRLLKARRENNLTEEMAVCFQMESLLCATMQHLTCVVDLLDTDEHTQKDSGDNIVIPKWKFKRIHEAIRLSMKYREDIRERKKLPETCLDRTLDEAWDFSKETISESERESRNAKIRNKLSPLSNIIQLIEDLSCNPNVEYRDLLVKSMINLCDDLKFSLEELKKLL